MIVKNCRKQLCACFLAGIILLQGAVFWGAQAGLPEAFKQEWKTICNDWTYVALSPGSDETQMNFAWYSKNGEPVRFRYGQKRDLSDGKTVKIKQKKAQKGYRSNKVTLKNLKPGATYYYQADRKEVAPFHTNEAGDMFHFIYVGDPQIGKSNPIKQEEYLEAQEEYRLAQSDAACRDAFGWRDTINKAYKKSGKKADFILSAGDQVQTNACKALDKTVSEIEYSGFLCPKLLRSVPVATTVGGHDGDNPNYDYHFHVPNQSFLGQNKYVGGDYWFTYGSALFMMLNTQDSNTKEHKEFMEGAIRKNPDCTWRIVTLHQDIYGSAKHSSDEQVIKLRNELVKYFDGNGIDVVLTGHDHSYTRSKFLKAGLPVEPEIVDGAAVNPEGILYMAAGSSSGSRYYDLAEEKQAYVAARWQGGVPTYSIVEVTESTFTIDTYRTDNGEKIDDTVKIQKSIRSRDISQASVDAIGTAAYTGKGKKPAVFVRLNKLPLICGKDYTVSYQDNIEIGTAGVTVTGIGAFVGTKASSFQIVPAKTQLQSAVSHKKQRVTVRLKNGLPLTGYQIVYSTSKRFKTFHKKETKKAKITLKSLKKGKVYYIKARGYQRKSGITYYGKYGKAIKVTVKA